MIDFFVVFDLHDFANCQTNRSPTSCDNKVKQCLLQFNIRGHAQNWTINARIAQLLQRVMSASSWKVFQTSVHHSLLLSPSACLPPLLLFVSCARLTPIWGSVVGDMNAGNFHPQLRLAISIKSIQHHYFKTTLQVCTPKISHHTLQSHGLKMFSFANCLNKEGFIRANTESQNKTNESRINWLMKCVF